jgi:hypothetical protein
MKTTAENRCAGEGKGREKIAEASASRIENSVQRVAKYIYEHFINFLCHYIIATYTVNKCAVFK